MCYFLSWISNFLKELWDCKWWRRAYVYCRTCYLDFANQLSYYFTILLCVIYFLAVFLNLSVQYSAVFSFRLNIDGMRNSRCKIFWSPFSISLRRHTTFHNQKALLLNQILMNVFFDIVMQTFCIAGQLVIAIAKVSLPPFPSPQFTSNALWLNFTPNVNLFQLNGYCLTWTQNMT